MAETDPVEGGGLYNKIFKFKYIQKEDVPTALQHACEYLFVSMKCLGYEEHMEEDFRDIFKSILESTLGQSFMAIDTETGKIAGLRVIMVVKKSDPEEPEFPFKFEQNRILFAYMLALGNQCKIWERYPAIDKFADLFGISVNPEHRRKGLATEIYRRTLAMLKLRGFSLARCGFSSSFSRKAAYNLGCKQIIKEMCSEAKTPEGRLINPNADPEDFLDYGVFEL